MSMIEESSEAQQHVTSSSESRPSVISTRKRGRKIASASDPVLVVPTKTRKAPRTRQPPTAKNKKDSTASTSAISHSEYDSGIHPDILAALEACESSELT